MKRPTDINIAGLQKCSLVDYPGKVCAVIFLAGCNMNCGYCHNRQLIDLPSREAKENAGICTQLDEAEVLSFLLKRKKLLDGVCITGGEPTLSRGLKQLILKIKAIGLAVKLDTNGTNPKLLSELLKDNLLDYIAMDVKAPEHKYEAVCGRAVSIENIRRSINIIRNSGIDYEFRTTFEPGLRAEDIQNIAVSLSGSRAYYLQQYRATGTEQIEQVLDGNHEHDEHYEYDEQDEHGFVLEKSLSAHSREYVIDTWEAVKDNFMISAVRGL